MAWPVFPLWSVNEHGQCLCGNEKCEAPGKHPQGKLAPNGLKNASTDRETVQKWFSEDGLNIGILTGPESGLVVLDVDPRHGGDESIEQLEAEHGTLNTLEAATGGGGRHLFFQYPDEGEVRCSNGKLASGLDIKANGGYIVAPPSVHGSGGKYSWKQNPEEVAPSALPDWLVTDSESEQSTFNIEEAETLSKGNRNQTLFHMGCSLRSKGLSRDEIEAALLKANENRCNPPLDTAEIESIADSVAKYEAGRLIQKETNDAPYEMHTNGLVWHKPTKDGPTPVPLTNFTAKIIGDVVWDDGAERSQVFEIEATSAGSTQHFIIQASQFNSMGWVVEEMGAGAVVYAGYGQKDHARAAIQLLSGRVPRRVIYTHCGWRKIGDEWVYLHAGGAIGADGTVEGIEIHLEHGLDRYVLDYPKDDKELIEAVKTSLDVLKIAPDHIIIPAYCAIWRSVLGNIDLSVHLSGPTGTGKSELAALIQQHFGAGMDSRHLPGSWMSTNNALEGLAFLTKDTVLVVDDFAPSGSKYDVQRLHAKAAYIFRAQGNQAGRQRMKADATLRPAKPPRGLILSTGEDIPNGQSVRARVLIAEVSRDDVKWHEVSRCQEDARSGLYAKVTYGYIKWLCSRYEDIKKNISLEIAEVRQELVLKAAHKRTPDVTANLLIGMRQFLCFAEDIGALTSQEKKELEQRCRNALLRAAEAQAIYQTATEPAQRFLELISAALTTGQAHVVAPDGSAPEKPEAWGWSDHDERGRRPQGQQIGWVDGDMLYLDPEASYNRVQSLPGAEGVSITPQTLKRRLNEEGFIIKEERRESLTVRRMLEGRQHEVLYLNSKAMDLLGVVPDKPDIFTTCEADNTEPF